MQSSSVLLKPFKIIKILWYLPILNVTILRSQSLIRSLPLLYLTLLVQPDGALIKSRNMYHL
jgi:hypothetical protein